MLPLNRHRVFLKSFLGDHKLRLKTLVESLGGRVLSTIRTSQRPDKEVPTLVICPNGERRKCPAGTGHLLSTHRIVRERWLDGMLAAEPLPDFKPHAVYAQVRDLRDPRSYFYGAVAAADMTQDRDDFWKVIPEDWTPSAGGG